MEKFHPEVKRAALDRRARTMCTDVKEVYMSSERDFFYPFVEQCVAALVLLQEVGGTMVYKFLIDMFSLGVTRAVLRQ